MAETHNRKFPYNVTSAMRTTRPNGNVPLSIRTPSPWNSRILVVVLRGASARMDHYHERGILWWDVYNVDPEKVFVTGGSSGAMISNVLAATYPELIKAVWLYSGGPAGYFASASGGVAEWNSQCSQGQVVRTPQECATIVQNMYPGYNGARRPKMQIWHGSADTTLFPQNYEETIKQWTAVFNVSQTPTSVRQNYLEQMYTTSDYGLDVQGIYAEGTGHSVLPHLQDLEAWFGL
ncbi:hypothetical protein AJ80_07956 [Polytolypa hystricis UAMH7299]|uniref:Uncharacterized protein n=1 Tax=Polytolypa hystricis (strain UAMH7299) TaxID=1447883 RepID=A0A2B7XG52_POLH7|nr:hypothetical protein AJ80_07956 [Polytolypa hystricis UAMH7299]